tara:strand:+ start:112 stop:423 length:312 start_codon:yes stop_codon:yes gene_type:complete
MELSKNKLNIFKGRFDNLSILKAVHPLGEMYFCGSNKASRWRVNTIFTKEASNISWLDRLQPKDLLLDVGANIGLYSIYAALQNLSSLKLSGSFLLSIILSSS